jgi:hypothetical protein
MRRLTVSVLAGGLSLMAMAAVAAPVITVNPHSAPNVFGSPSYDPYELLVMAALQNGGPASAGNRNTSPTAYELLAPNATSIVKAGDMIVTAFNSWRGTADPGAPFGSEGGNRMHFALTIISPDASTPFTLRDIGFTMNGATPDWQYGFVPVTGYTGSNEFDDTLFPTGINYQPWRIGVQYGADGVFGGGDDIILAPGTSGDTLVNALFYVGVGDAYWPDPGPVPGYDLNQPADRQRLLTDTELLMGLGLPAPFFLTGSYYLVNQATPGGPITQIAQAAATATVPEPASLALLGAGLLGLSVARRRGAAGR